MQCAGKVLEMFVLHVEALDKGALHEGDSGGCFMRRPLSMCMAGQVGTVPHHRDLGLAGSPSPR